LLLIADHIWDLGEVQVEQVMPKSDEDEAMEQMM